MSGNPTTIVIEVGRPKQNVKTGKKQRRQESVATDEQAALEFDTPKTFILPADPAPSFYPNTTFRFKSNMFHIKKLQLWEDIAIWLDQTGSKFKLLQKVEIEVTIPPSRVRGDVQLYRFGDMLPLVKQLWRQDRNFQFSIVASDTQPSSWDANAFNDIFNKLVNDEFDIKKYESGITCMDLQYLAPYSVMGDPYSFCPPTEAGNEFILKVDLGSGRKSEPSRVFKHEVKLPGAATLHVEKTFYAVTKTL